MNIYEELGVPVIINAKGPATRLSGALMVPEVVQAMAEAAEHCVDIAGLQAAAGRRIAGATGAEAGYVTSGAAAGLLLATAACVARLDPARMARLPHTSGMAREVVMVRSQRNFYDHAVRTAGIRLVEAGLPDRYAGAGVRDVQVWELEEAISTKTAAVFYVADRFAQPPLSDVVRVAHAAGVPVIVDAAAQLPPASNLKRFITQGADLVAFSGGKAIGGPQATGILAGRRDLIMSAACQHLDFDILEEQWQPPEDLIDRSRLKGVPRSGIGRPCKVGREDIAGLMKALELFLAESDEARHARWLEAVRAIATDLEGLNGVSARISGAEDVSAVPTVELKISPSASLGALELAIRLQNADPSVHVDPTCSDRGSLHINPMCLTADQAPQVAAAVRSALQ